MNSENNNLISSHAKKVSQFLQNYKESTGEIKLDGKSLSIADIHLVFKNNLRSVCLSGETEEAIQKSYECLMKKLSQGYCVYGVNTGLGGSANVRHEKSKDVQEKVIVHLNVGFGEKLPLMFVKAAMLVRANSLSRGYSGVDLKVVQLLVELLNHDIIPYVPKRGSISASGDLIPTSYIAACLKGNPNCKVSYKGKDTVASLALAQAKLSPVVFEGKDALGLVNASSFAATLAADILYRGNVAILLTQAVVAMTTEALQGRLESFHPVVHETCLPHPGQQEVARNIRMFLSGTNFSITHEVDEIKFLKEGLRQDRYGLRTSPQWLGPTLETALESIKKVIIELNSANDNPIIDSKTNQILHCGNFQGTSTTVAMDQFRQSMQLCGKLLFALFSEIVDCSINNDLPPNLCGENPSVDMGFKGTEIAMASYTSELDYLTNPVSNHVLSAELRNQSVNSLALISARLSETALELFQMQLTNILCALAQAIELRWIKKQVESLITGILASDSYTSVERSASVKLVPWYKFLYQPNETIGKLLKNWTGPDDATPCNSALRDKLQNQMESLMDNLKTGKLTQKVAQDMGVGTKPLYLFVRGTLGIQFHDGENPLDVGLQSIFDSLNDGRIDDVVFSLTNILLS